MIREICITTTSLDQYIMQSDILLTHKGAITYFRSFWVSAVTLAVSTSLCFCLHLSLLITLFLSLSSPPSLSLCISVSLYLCLDLSVSLCFCLHFSVSMILLNIKWQEKGGKGLPLYLHYFSSKKTCRTFFFSHFRISFIFIKRVKNRSKKTNRNEEERSRNESWEKGGLKTGEEGVSHVEVGWTYVGLNPHIYSARCSLPRNTFLPRPCTYVIL